MSLQSRLASLISALGADVKSLRTTENSLEAATFSRNGVLVTGAGSGRWPVAGGTFQVVTVAAMVGVAPAGSSIIADVVKNGTSIYGTAVNKPTVAAGSNSATVGAHSATTVTSGDYLTVNVDQIGSTTPGSDLVVVIRLQRIS